MKPDFAFGSTIWPGLSKLLEESGETVQVIGKLIMTGGNTNHWDGTDLEKRLIEEMADLQAAIYFVVDNCLNDDSEFRQRSMMKLKLFEKWHNGEVV